MGKVHGRDKCKECKIRFREVSPPSVFCEECREKKAEAWKKQETWKTTKEFKREGL